MTILRDWTATTAVLAVMRPSSLFLLVLAGCSGTHASSSSSTGGTPDLGSSSSGDASTPTPPVCTDETNFDTDAKNCGRCGRACDDGACNAGICAPRVEATSATLPDTIGTEIAIVEGRLYASMMHSPIPYTPNSKHPVVRFENGKPVTVMADAKTACGEPTTECLVSDGKTLFVHVVVGDQTTGTAGVIKRFNADGTALKDMFLPDDGYGFPKMAAEAGRVVVRGTVGPTALFEEDGKVVRLSELRYGSWPVIAGGEVYVANKLSVDHVAVGSGVSIVGKLPGGAAHSFAANERFLYVLTEVGQGRIPTVNRFVRTGSEAPPERTETLPSTAIEALNKASINVSGAMLRTLDERSIVNDGRYYFAVLVSSPDSRAQARVIMEWSEDRGFRTMGTIPYEGETGTRLTVGNGRLYWLEQPLTSDATRPPWRIVSVPL